MIGFYKTRMEHFQKENMMLREHINTVSREHNQSSAANNVDSINFLCESNMQNQNNDTNLFNTNEVLEERLIELEMLQTQLNQVKLS